MKNKPFCVVDIELTEDKEIIQFSATKLSIDFKKISSIDYYVKPKKEISSFVSEFTGITPEMLEDKPLFKEIAYGIYEYIKDCTLVCHGLQSDYLVIKKNFMKVGIKYIPYRTVDTVELARILFPTQKSYRLVDLSNSLNLYSGTGYHNALIDVEVTVNLLKKIAEKIQYIDESNYLKVKEILKRKETGYFEFFNLCRKDKFEDSEDNYIIFDGIKFKKIRDSNLKPIEKGNILFSCIDEYDYININNIDNYEVLKQKNEYVPLNIFSMFSKHRNSNLDNLLIKLYIWVLETESGDLSELNLLSSELKFLEDIKNLINISSKSYYFEKKYIASKSKENIVTNHKNIEFLFSKDYFNKYKLIFDDKKILGRELNILNVEYYHYRQVITELNIVISQNPALKYLREIQNNLNSLVKFLHEMYISESLYLYNDSLDFIVQDIDEIIKVVKKYSKKIPLTKVFLINLKKTLTNEKNSYKFEIIDQENSLFLKVINEKNVKNIINTIHTRDTKYLRKKTKLSICYLDNLNEINTAKTLGKILYVFKSDKYRDLFFSKREKKSNVKYVNFTSTDSFSELFTDVKKNIKPSYICFATKDILYYKYYLNKIFDNIIVLNNAEL